MADEYTVSEGLDPNYIYIDNETHDERELIIHFLSNYTRSGKAAILREIAKWLEEKDKTTPSTP